MRSASLYSRIFFTVLLIGMSFCPGQLTLGQETQGEAAEAQADSTVLLPVPATEISREYDASSDMISESSGLRLTQEQIDNLHAGLDSVKNEVRTFLGDSILNTLEQANIRELDNARNKVNGQMDQISEVKDRIGRRARDIEEVMLELSAYNLRWQLTKEQADEKGIPRVLQERVDDIIFDIDSAGMLLQEDFNTLLVSEDALSDYSKQLKAINDSISFRIEIIGKNIFSRDMPPFFKDLANLEVGKMFRQHTLEIKEAYQAEFKLIERSFKGQLWMIALLILAALISAFWLKKHYSRLIPGDRFELTVLHLAILERPVASSLFLITLIIRIIFAELADSINAINLFIFMVPLIIIVLRAYSEKASPWIELLIIFYFATFFYDLAYYPDILQRLVLMGLSILGTVFFVMGLIKAPSVVNMKNKFLFSVLRSLLGLFAAFCVAAIFGNLYGAFRMAEYFTLTFMQITMLFLAIFVSTSVVSAVVFILMTNKYLQSLNLMKEDFQVIHRKITWLVTLLLWIHFVIGALEILSLKEAFLSWGGDVLNEGWNVGAVDITPASILIFIFVIWLSIMISRIISRILEKDVFPRVSTSKGVPNTIIMLLKIALISGGFFLAAAAAGMHLNNLSLVLGAFSVGIGFGLQNVINNMVSGLILAFERPISVGDTVQVDDLMGVVRSIGFRSSTVRSFDGAEVIVPNGNLISDRMINWTRNDYIRRMDLRVGVAYGTDPEKVLEILAAIGKDHKLVRQTPVPKAFFIGFGDSSLDFRLLAWVDIDNRLDVESELNVTIYKKLEEAGIEIPFPQRDLHIRSDSTK